MTEHTIQKIQQLLQIRYDTTAWYAKVEALDKEEVLPVLISLLNNTDESASTRSQVTTLLGILKDKRALDPLLEARHSDHGLLRARAALALAQIGIAENKVVSSLMQGLGDDDAFVRECCAKALALMKCSEAIPSLEQMSANDSVSTNRDVAQEAIQVIRGQANYA